MRTLPDDKRSDTKVTTKLGTRSPAPSLAPPPSSQSQFPQRPRAFFCVLDDGSSIASGFAKELVEDCEKQGSEAEGGRTVALGAGGFEVARGGGGGGGGGDGGGGPQCRLVPPSIKVMADRQAEDENGTSQRQTAEDYSASDPSARARIASRNPAAAATARPRITSYGGTPLGEPPTPGTPRTPILSRSFSSNFNSPGATFRTDDDVFVLEFGARYLRVGLGGESKPRCQMLFGPEERKRVGDFSSYIPSLTTLPQKRARLGPSHTWGYLHELWQMDLRTVDLGLMSDKIERAVRNAISEHVLVQDDVKRRLFVLAVPPVLPGPILSTLLTTLFNGYPVPPSITVLPSPLLCTMAAGLRSALVIDLGWAETTISAMYEYRQVLHRFSSRAMKRVHWKLASTLNAAVREELKARDIGSHEAQGSVTFEESEEVLFRMAWIHPDKDATADYSRSMVEIPIPSHPEISPLRIPFPRLSEPVAEMLFPGRSPGPGSIHENGDLPLCDLIYHSLLSLPIDIRGHVLPRIIITGGGSNITGMKSRIMSELTSILRDRGWDPVNDYGSAKPPDNRPNTMRKSRVRQEGPVEVDPTNIKEDATDRWQWEPVKADTSVEMRGSAEAKQAGREGADTSDEKKDVADTQQYQQTEPTNRDIDPDSTTPAHLQPPLPDPFYRPSAPPSSVTAARPQSGAPPAPPLRSVNTLGAWAGASLLSGLRVKAAAAEIERERFLAQGLAGFSLDEDRIVGAGESGVSADGGAGESAAGGGGLGGIGRKGGSAMFGGGR
ncbi:MAG: hypothetical protein M1831_003790 [Alyxoria varia]|nr:MAG: hypothetical protein M1831_003790 [Alyxoria varia]